MTAKDKYEVTVDGNTETVKNKTEVTKTLVEALSDGEQHTVELDEVKPEPKAEKVKEETPEVGPGTDALGITHIR